MFLQFLRSPMLVVWHLSWEEKTTHKLHTRVLTRGLLGGTDVDFHFPNCSRELQNQTLTNFGRKWEPSCQLS